MELNETYLYNNEIVKCIHKNVSNNNVTVIDRCNCINILSPQEQSLLIKIIRPKDLTHGARYKTFKTKTDWLSGFYFPTEIYVKYFNINNKPVFIQETFSGKPKKIKLNQDQKQQLKLVEITKEEYPFKPKDYTILAALFLTASYFLGKWSNGN